MNDKIFYLSMAVSGGVVVQHTVLAVAPELRGPWVDWTTAGLAFLLGVGFAHWRQLWRREGEAKPVQVVGSRCQ